MRKFIGISLALVFLLAIGTGCARNRGVTPTPLPVNPATTNPGATYPGTTTPGTDIGGTGTAGNAGTAGNGTDVTGKSGTVGSAGAAGTQNGTSGNITTIPNFKEGTEVHVSDVPDIKSALQERYEGATISTIKHGLHNNAQVYIVEYTGQNGVKNTAYISPSGEFMNVGQNVVTP